MLISKGTKDVIKYTIIAISIIISIILYIFLIIYISYLVEQTEIALHNKGAKLRIEKIKLDIEEHKLIRQKHKALNTDLAVYKSEYKAPEETDKDKDKQK